MADHPNPTPPKSPFVPTDDGRVFVRSKNGDLFKLDEKHAAEAVARGEYDPATAGQVATRMQELTTSAPGAFARGVATGTIGTVLAPGKAISGLGAAALGVEDPLAKISGHQVVGDLAAIGAHLTGGESELAGRLQREQFQADEEFHPYATGGGQFVGSVIGSGGLAAAGRAGAGLAARGLGAIGAGARAAKIGAGIAGAAIEGAGLGADAASENAWLKNQTVTADQTLAGIGMGALFAGATGGLFGAVGSRGAGKAAKLSEQLAEQGGAEAGAGAAAGGLEGAAARAEGAGARVAGEAGMGAGVAAPAAETAAAEEAGSVIGRKGATATAPLEEANAALGPRARGWMSGLKEGAGEFADRAIVEDVARGNKAALRDLAGGKAPSAERLREVGGLIHDLGIPAAGRSPAEMASVAQQRVQEVGNRIGKVMEAADARVAQEGAGQLAPKSEEAIFGKIEALKTKLTEGAILPQQKQLANYIEENTAFLRDKAAKGELLPSDMWKFRQEVDTLAKWARAEPGPKAEAARELRRVIEDHIQEEIAKTTPDLLQNYVQAKKLYGAASWAADTLGERVGTGGANKMFSLSDYLTGGALLASGNPLAAAAGLAGKKLFRERGMSTAAVLAKKLAGESVDVAAAPLGAMPLARNLQTMVAHTEEHIANGIGNFFSGKGGAAGGAAPAAARFSTAAALRSKDVGEAMSAYQKHAREVQMVAANPELAASRLASITGPNVAAMAPGLNAQMAQIASRCANYLLQNMPAPPTDPDSITPQLDTPPPISDSDRHVYADRVEGIENPLSLVDDLKHDKASAAKTDAVQVGHPEVFQRIQSAVFEQLSQLDKPVPYPKRLTLDLALNGNGALEPSLKSANLKIMAAANKAVAAASAPKAPRMPRGPSVSSLYSTRSAQISAGRG